MQIRTQWGNMAAVYRQFNQTLKKGFDGLNGKMNDYNAFIQANTNVVKVYVPRSVRLNGGSVLAPYQITRGTLPSVAMVKNGGGVLLSDVRVGSLVIVNNRCEPMYGRYLRYVEEIHKVGVGGVSLYSAA